MDPITHGLASFAATRAFFPRASRAAVLVAIAAGTAADLDGFSQFLGPPAYFAADRTLTHSVVAALLIAAITAGISSAASRSKDGQRAPFLSALATTSLAALLHLAMDLCQSGGVPLLWPFRLGRYALDLLGAIDPWILTVFLAGVLLPALLRLVTEEIGARGQGPRGRTGAMLALFAVVAYTGARGFLHATAVAALDARTYHGEIARRAAALPESASPFEWRGIVETQSALHQVTIATRPEASFDPEAALTIFKPEPSTVLDVASNSETARRFLAIARFPKATIERTADGYRFTLRDLRYATAGDTEQALAVLVELGMDARIQREGIVWEHGLPK